MGATSGAPKAEKKAGRTNKGTKVRTKPSKTTEKKKKKKTKKPRVTRTARL